MTDLPTITRISELKKLLSLYSHQYHSLDNATVSDAVYDGLLGELKSLEDSHPELITPDSPTQRIGSTPTKKFEQHTHSQRMMSLLDCFSDEEAYGWLERISKLDSGVSSSRFFVDSKKDGLACALQYEDGILVRGITRGDGTVGEVVTANVRTIKSIPLRLQGDSKFTMGYTEIRGEIIMLKSDFVALNVSRIERGEPEFANPRNLAAGTIRQLDPKLVAERKLQFHGYDLIRNNADEIPTVSVAYASMQELGFIVDKNAHVESNFDQVLSYAHIFGEERHDLAYNTDGLVIKIDDRRLQNRLGSVGKNPRGAIAYKYPAEQATTVVKDIVISIGRTGAATPVAVFDPVVVSGSTVRHASLHNADEIKRKDIRVGDSVVVYKAGDIIPQVESVITELRPKSAKTFLMEPELRRQYPELEFERPEGEVVYRVVGATGPLLLKRALEHFASKPALDIDSMGEKNVSALVDAGLVQDLADIYTLKKDQILKLDRFADLSADNLLDAIEKVKSPTFPRFIYALGIRHVGAQTAIDLANHYKRLDNLGTAEYSDLKQISGIGEIVAESILAWFSDQDNLNMLAKFRKLGVWPQEVKQIGGKLLDQKFALTGSLESMQRAQAAEKIRSLGGIFQSSLGKDTDYLVMGTNVGAGKIKKAEEFNTKILNENEFTILINS